MSVVLRRISHFFEQQSDALWSANSKHVRAERVPFSSVTATVPKHSFLTYYSVSLIYGDPLIFVRELGFWDNNNVSGTLVKKLVSFQAVQVIQKTTNAAGKKTNQ